MHRPDPYPLADLALSRGLERTEARSNAAFVESRARLRPERGATWAEIAGAYAMFDGVGSPLTQSFGLGLDGTPDEAEMEALEAFFRERGAEVYHEVSPLADPGLLGLLASRGYRPVELSSVLFRPTDTGLGEAAAPAGEVRVRRVGEEEADLWARVAAEGWSSESAELEAFVRDLGETSSRSRDTHCFLAERDGRPIAAAGLFLGEDVALLAGASTVPSGRRRGAQRALLEARLRFAAERGRPLAMMGAAPGSGSQRNAERQGFRVAYTRIKWGLRPS